MDDMRPDQFLHEFAYLAWAYGLMQSLINFFINRYGQFLLHRAPPYTYTIRIVLGGVNSKTGQQLPEPVDSRSGPTQNQRLGHRGFPRQPGRLLGLGVNAGIRSFKRKWGAEPFLPYVGASWELKPRGIISKLYSLVTKSV
jgi:hypothetical protein